MPDISKLSMAITAKAVGAEHEHQFLASEIRRISRCVAQCVVDDMTDMIATGIEGNKVEKDVL